MKSDTVIENVGDSTLPCTLYRYMELDTALTVLDSGLCFSRASDFLDKNEFNFKPGKLSQTDLKELYKKYSPGNEVERALRNKVLLNKGYRKKLTKEMEKSYSTMCNENREELLERYYVCCFTDQKDNKRMWEEYADNGKGLMMAFNVNKLLNLYNGDYMYLMKVTYQSASPELPLGIWAESSDEAMPKIKRILFCKKEAFSWENEFRLLLNTERTSHVSEEMYYKKEQTTIKGRKRSFIYDNRIGNVLEEIVFGPDMLEESKLRIKQIVEGKGYRCTLSN